MTQSSRPHTGTTIGDAGPYSAAQWWEIYKYMPGASDANSGPLIGSGTAPEIGLTVAETSPASAGVRVFEGRAILQGTFYESDATETIAIAANASGNARIDTIILRRDTSLQTVRLAVLQGTPAASPSAPTLTQTAAIYEIPLADVAVANGFTTITNTNITPRRHFANAADGVYLLDVLNNSAGSLEAGDVVVWDTAANRAANTTTTLRNANVMGVWLNRTAAGGYGRVLRQGIGYVQTTGAATRGDFLGVSTTTKKVDVIASGAASTVSQSYVIGVALETTSGAGLCLALINVYWHRRPAYSVIKRNNGANYSTTSATFVNIDGTNLSITLPVHTGRVRISFVGTLTQSAGNQWHLDFTVDGTRYNTGATNGMVSGAVGSVVAFVSNGSFSVLVEGLSAGNHTFTMQWRVDANSVALGASAGTEFAIFIAEEVL